MAEYTAVIEWDRGGAPFLDHRYSRAHRWLFDGGVEVAASSSPHVVPLPMSLAEAVDPEEAFVASLSSCHMLWFLAIAAKRGFVVDAYRDQAVGELARDEAGNLMMSRVTFRPEVSFSGHPHPTDDEQTAMHHETHDQCFIARSVRTEVRCEPVYGNVDSRLSVMPMK